MPKKEDKPGSGKIALVMDDQEMLREVAAAMLEELDFQVLHAQEGAEAVAVYQRSLADGCPITLVILDLAVPDGMGGAEAACRILQLDAGAKIIICSGLDVESVKVQHAEIGFCGVISKPYHFDDLKRAVDSVM